jgi:hypothetical protein
MTAILRNSPTPRRSRGIFIAAIFLGLTARLPIAAHAQTPAWSETLLNRVKQVDAKRLPPHPRLVLSEQNIARIKRASESEFGQPYWQTITAWLEREQKAEPLSEPAPQKAGADGTKNMAEFRRIQASAEDVESHIVVAAGVYRITGNRRYLELVRAWVKGVVHWDPHGATGLKADDYAARQTLYALAVAYDGLYGEWTAEERATMRTCMLARGADLYERLSPLKQDEYNNHPWFQCSALIDAGLALADESADADRWWRYGSEVYLTHFLPLAGDDGSWHEGINYTTFTLKYVCHFANSLTSATGINPFNDVPWMRNVGYFRLYLAPPGSIGIYFNDTRPLAVQQWDRPIAFRLAAETHDPVLQWYATATPRIADLKPTSSFYTLLYRDPDLPATRPDALPLARNFSALGWIVSRTDLASGNGVEFGFKSQPWSTTPRRTTAGHDHPDANNFLLNYLGKPLLVDSGFYDYFNSPHHQGWTKTGRAHNTLLIDGQEQLPSRPGKIVTFESNPGTFDWMEGEGAQSYPDGLVKSWRREVLFLRPNIFVVRDVVRTTKPVQVTWLLHGASPFELDGQSFICRNEPAAVTGVIAWPAKLAVKQWTGFPPGAEPERKTPADLREFPDQSHLEWTTAGKSDYTTFITVFSPSRADDASPLEVSVSSDRETDTVKIRRDTTFPPATIGDLASPLPRIAGGAVGKAP